MSTLRVGGVCFRIYPADHAPRHVHGSLGGVSVIVDLRADGTVALAGRQDAIRPANPKRSDVKKILVVARDNFEVLVSAWERMHP